MGGPPSGPSPGSGRTRSPSPCVDFWRQQHETIWHPGHRPGPGRSGGALPRRVRIHRPGRRASRRHRLPGPGHRPGGTGLLEQFQVRPAHRAVHLLLPRRRRLPRGGLRGQAPLPAGPVRHGQVPGGPGAPGAGRRQRRLLRPLHRQCPGRHHQRRRPAHHLRRLLRRGLPRRRHRLHRQARSGRHRHLQRRHHARHRRKQDPHRRRRQARGRPLSLHRRVQRHHPAHQSRL